MSSHHIVREKQEPALYIHELGDFNEEYLGQLLEWSPTLIVNAAEYEKVVSLGLKVDIVVHQLPEGQVIQENTKTIMGPGDDFNTVLNFLINEKYSAVNIIVTTHKLADLSYYIPSIDLVLFNAQRKTYAVDSGFSVWRAKGSLFYIDVISYFETSNLKQVDGEVFEVINDGFVEFTFSTPYLLISEKL